MLYVAVILFIVIAMWSFMEDVMPVTHVDCNTELFGSHRIVGMCSHGNVGFMEAVILCPNGGLCAFLLCVGRFRAVAQFFCSG